MMKVNKFPNEDIVGIRVENNKIVTPVTNFFLIHWFDNINDDTLGLKKLILNEINKGNIHPDFFASLSNLHNEPMFSLYNNIAYVIISDTVLSPKFNNAMLSEIDSNRLSLGMHTFEEYRKVVRYGNYDKRFILNKASQIDILMIDNKKEINKIIQVYESLGFQKVGTRQSSWEHYNPN